MRRTNIGIVGVGKIARDQHIPVIRGDGRFSLVAGASRNATVDGVRNFSDLEAMLEGMADIDAVSICTPPQTHFEAVKLALLHKKHVLLEKPPCTTTAELAHLARLAKDAGRVLYQTWHSRHAAGVAPAREWLAARKLRAVRVIWKEDVRQWHPGQTWIWKAGGFGVFDPGINAISILTEILPEPFFVARAHLKTPSNCQSPIAADIGFAAGSGARIEAEFDFRHTGIQTWDIDIETDKGTLKLSLGGSRLFIDGAEKRIPGGERPHGEYESVYGRFADLVERGQSDVDAGPFQLVADCFLVATHETVEPFQD